MDCHEYIFGMSKYIFGDMIQFRIRTFAMKTLSQLFDSDLEIRKPKNFFQRWIVMNTYLECRNIYLAT